MSAVFPPGRPSWSVAAVTMLWLILVAPVTLYLLSASPRWLDRSLTIDRLAYPQQAVGILQSLGPEVSRELPVWTVGTPHLQQLDEVALLVSPGMETVIVTAAALQVGSCRFSSAEPTRVIHGTLLTLVRSAPCAPTQIHEEEPGQLLVTMRGAAELSLLGWAAPARSDTGATGLTLTPPGSRDRSLFMMRGRSRQYGIGPVMSRFELIRWLWDDRTGTRTLMLLGLCAALAWASLWLMLTWNADSSGHFWRAAATAGGSALTMALAWVLVIPPLQGADGPDHVLSYGEVIGDSGMGERMEGLARRVHFERVRFMGNEYLAAVDTIQPFAVAWTGDIHAERMPARSPVTAALWRAVAPLANSDSPARTLQRLRLVNAALFALAAALAAALLAWTHRDGSPWMLVGAAIAPSVPYFAAMLSDWAVMVPWLLLGATGVLMLAIGGPRSQWAGAVLGVSGALLIGTSISALPAVVLLGLLVLLRMVAGDHDGAPWRFWLGIAAGAVLLPIVTGDLGQVGFQRFDAEGRASFAALLTLVNGVLGTALSRPWSLLPVVAALALIDHALTPWRQRIRESRRLQGVLGALALAPVVAAVTELVWSALGRPMPLVRALEARGSGSLPDYVREVLVSVVTGARLTGFDHLTFSSLWGGFGWIDALLPDRLLDLVVILLVLGLAGLWRSARPALRLWGLTSLAVGIIGVALVAAASFLMGRNVHGRYLLPVVLPVTIIALGAAGHLAGRTRSVRWRAVALLPLVVLHGLALLSVAQRYYGPR